MDEYNDTYKMRKADIDESKILSRIEKTRKKQIKKMNKITGINNDNAEKTETSIIEPVESGEESEKKHTLAGGYKFEYTDTEIIDDEDDEKPMLFFEKPDSKLINEEIESEEMNDNMNNISGGIFNKEVKSEVLDWLKHILIAVVIGLLLVVFVVQRNEVVGSSMEPTLYHEDQLIVQKITRLFDSGIKHGDIITIDATGLPYHDGDNNIIKRVIGLPGDFIEIKDDAVFRNGQRIDEDYLDDVITSERRTEYSSVLLGDDQIYILGDNRPVSLDSRTFGPVERDRVVGGVLVRFYPFSTFGRP